MEAILFALFSYFGWGIGDIFGVVASKKIGGYATNLWSFTIRAGLFALYLPFCLDQIKHLTLFNTAFSIILALIFILGSISFLEACRHTNVAVVGAIGGAYAVPTILLSVLFLHESLNILQVIAITIIIFGVLLSSIDTSLQKEKFKINKGVMLAICAILFWGTYFAFVKIPVKEIGWFLPNYAIYLLSPIILLMMYLRKIPISSPFRKNTAVPLGIYTLLASAGNFGYNIGIMHGFASIVAPISGAYPTIFVLLSFFLFKDKITKQQIAGILISLIGIVYLSFLSV